ncbi:iron-siderophore ABC transporter substrate-binding protein [Microbacterium sp. A93]|uniref:iron-siderophore ABC transporter substrate-binding protein n=1 Tax=Microbacterium sp. A93 TaxID=3450716 RepID=UPI003F434788
MRSPRSLTLPVAVSVTTLGLVLALSACGGPANDAGPEASAAGSSGSPADGSADTVAGTAGEQQFPLTIEHALGTTTIESAPERVATVQWANHEVPLALGVVPVGMAAANFGDDDGDGILPWVEDALEELGGEEPVLFDETDGIDFEAVADTDPDVILASYSGLTQQDYDTLSQIAPVVAFPETAWGTSWQDMITLNSQGMGMAAEGEELITELEGDISEAAAKHPELAEASAMFVTHVDTGDLSEVNFYTSHDTRVMFFSDLGLQTPTSVQEASAGTEEFSGTISAEQVDQFDDVDVIVTYGDQELVDVLEGDELLSRMPAVENNAIVALDGTGPMGTAANPTPLSISYVLDEYVELLAEAAAHSGE